MLIKYLLCDCSANANSSNCLLIKWAATAVCHCTASSNTILGQSPRCWTCSKSELQQFPNHGEWKGHYFIKYPSVITLHVGQIYQKKHNNVLQAKRKYMLTCQVRRYCILAFHGSRAMHSYNFMVISVTLVLLGPYKCVFSSYSNK